MNSSMKTSTLIGVAVVLTIIAALLLALSNVAKQHRILAIDSYADCAAAGYPIMESYPEQCATPDGRTFVNTVQESPSDIALSGCQVGGCSSQLCGEVGEDLVSDCMYRPEYACYRSHSSCERQADGACGWSSNDTLTQCLANPPASE